MTQEVKKNKSKKPRKKKSVKINKGFEVKKIEDKAKSKEVGKENLEFEKPATKEDFVNNKKIPTWLWGIFLFLIVVIALEVVYLLNLFNRRVVVVDRPVSETEEEIDEDIFEGYPRIIDGVFVENEEDSKKWLVAVVFDNMIDARPSHGLSKANLVIEAVAEASITRILAFFDLTQEIEKIGPVRSARSYYAEWAGELEAVFAHSGGSPEALENLKNKVYNVFDLNEFYRGNYFWRDNGRRAPHNLFTSSELLGQAVENLVGQRETNYPVFKFKNDAELDLRGEDGQKIEVYFNETDHYVFWVYDREENNYIRYQGGKQHLEADGSEIRAKNIAIQYTTTKVLDQVGRKKIDTIDKKDAVVFRDGQIIEGFWEKLNKDSRTKFYLDENEEIEFNRGTTWIEVVPVGNKTSY